ncbi:MAG: F0F1 ATP synthase subunit B [Oscillospiraceae bacterium]|nr:F0F1 ATP synthase subunit B [Oscillospiraceae bacterium]
MDLHPVDILIALINIIVLFILLRLILWKPVNRYLSARSERVSSELANVDKIRDEATSLRSEYENKLEDAETRSLDIMRSSQAKASEDAAEILKDARDKSEIMLREARERIAEEKERAIVNSRHEVAQLATDLAARILKREVSESDTKNIVEEFFLETR